MLSVDNSNNLPTRSAFVFHNNNNDNKNSFEQVF